MGFDTSGIQSAASAGGAAGGAGFLGKLGGALGKVAGPLGLVTGIAGSIMSFSQAKKQREMQQEAQREADKAFKEAQDKLEVNYLEGLSIAKEPYELEREALLQAGASALQAGVEGETRGAAAVAGQALMAQQAGAAGQRAAMSREMQQLQQLAAQEESRLQGARTELDLAEARGQQQIAADAAAARQAALSAGIQGLGSMAMMGIESGALYGKSGAAGTQLPDRAIVDSQLKASLPSASVIDPYAGITSQYMPASTLPTLGQLKPR